MRKNSSLIGNRHVIIKINDYDHEYNDNDSYASNDNHNGNKKKLLNNEKVAPY
jgi:hypothetical protein